METEFQRRKEHKNDATNFEQVRGFVRTCWKTKYWDITQDPTQDDSSTDSEDEREANEIENRDRVDNTLLSGSASPGKLSRESSEARDYNNFDKSVGYNDSPSAFQRVQTATDFKTLKKLRSVRPQSVEIEDIQDDNTAGHSVQEQIDTL